jgi:hypothetical protein
MFLIKILYIHWLIPRSLKLSPLRWSGFLWMASWLNFAPKQPEKAIKMRFLICNATGAAKRGLRGGAGGL